jgi:hypothetical protein
MRIGRYIARSGTPTVTLLYDLRNLGLSSNSIDDHLIYLASIGTSLQIIDIRGNSPRTSASDDAFSTLINNENEIWEDE